MELRLGELAYLVQVIRPGAELGLEPTSVPLRTLALHPYRSDLTQTLPQPVPEIQGMDTAIVVVTTIYCVSQAVCFHSPQTAWVRYYNYPHFTERDIEAWRLKQTM